MNNLTVYLAGCESWYFKNNNNYYIEWRKEVEDWFTKFTHNVRVINPCNYFSFEHKYHKTDREIREFDLDKVRKSDVILVNLDHITDSVGALNEIFCAYEHRIPVIGFYEFTDNYDLTHSDKYKTESWILDTCLRIENDETSALIDACNYIKNYFLT